MQFVSVKSIWNREYHFTIPDIQRGLVWNAAQMEVFWDSLLRGIPVGIFTAAELNNETILLDGQQRYHAVKSAFDGTNGILWCCIFDEKSDINIYNRKYLFRWTTASHPWGWNFNADEKSSPRLSIGERRQVLEANGLQDKQLFIKPEVGSIKPYPCHKVQMVKFTDLLENESAPGHFSESEKKYYKDLRNKLLEIIELPLIPLLGSNISSANCNENQLYFKNPDAEWLDIFFRRMNSQGTPFTQTELAYSALKSAFQEIGIEKSREYFERISKKFKNTAEIAQTVFQLAVHILYQENINKSWNANDIKIFFKDKKGDAEKLNLFLQKMEHNFALLEQYRLQFNELDEKIEILPYHLSMLPSEILKTALIILNKKIDVSLFWGTIFLLYFFCKDDRVNGDKNCLANATGKIISAISNESGDNCDAILQKAVAECFYEGYLIPPADEKVLQDIDLTALAAGKFSADKEKDILIDSRLGKTFYWGNGKSFNFVTLACGKYLAKNFGDIKNLHEDNRPWDYDHCLPQAKSTALTAKMCWSSGNNVPIALTTNRSKQDELPNVNYPDNNLDSQKLLYLDSNKIAGIENTDKFNEFALARFLKMYKQIFKVFCWDELIAVNPGINVAYKEKANDILDCIGQRDECKWYYVMNDMEFPVESAEDFEKFKWFSLRNSTESAYAIATCDFKTFECAKRKATLSVVMRGVYWCEEYSVVHSKDEAINYLRMKWNMNKI